MAQSIGNILHEEDTNAVEKYGPLSGTDKQLEVVRVALENPDWEPDELADEVDSSEGYLRNLLRRATPEIVDMAREGQEGTPEETNPPSEPAPPDNETEEVPPPESPPAEQPAGAGDEGTEPDPVEAAMFDPEESEPSAVWHGGGIGELVEVSALEWCDECQARHRVIYLMPAAQIGYLLEPGCGHGGRYRDAGEAPREDVERVIDAIDQRAPR